MCRCIGIQIYGVMIRVCDLGAADWGGGCEKEGHGTLAFDWR